MDDPFAELDRMSGMMQARHEAMMRQAAELQQKVLAAHQRKAGAGQQSQVVVSTNLPAGSYSYSMVSTSRNGCTQTVEWRSDGSANEQQVTKTAPGIAAWPRRTHRQHRLLLSLATPR